MREPRSSRKSEGKDIQLFASRSMFIIVKEIIAALSPRARIDAGILAWLRGLQLAKGPRERSRRVLVSEGSIWIVRGIGVGNGGGLIAGRGFRKRLFSCRGRGEAVGEERRQRYIRGVKIWAESIESPSWEKLRLREGFSHGLQGATAMFLLRWLTLVQGFPG